MDVIASARVPVETKRLGDAKLKEIGANTTALINAAYEFLLKTGTLPCVQEARDAGEGRRLSPTQVADFQAFMHNTTLTRPDSWGEKTYEELYDEAMMERYGEHLG